MKGEITAGILVMGYQYMGYFAIPVATVCSIGMRYRSNKVHIERIDELEEEAAIAKENEAFKKENELLLKAENYDFYTETAKYLKSHIMIFIKAMGRGISCIISISWN